MSASSHTFLNPAHINPAHNHSAPGPDVLGELLHSLSQPLTGLRCSLELSLGLSFEPSLEFSLREVAERQQESVVTALQQTEKVIGMVQLMREYVDSEQPVPAVFSTALMPALRNLSDELSSISVVQDVQLCVAGSCRAIVPVPEARLRLALQYLITAVIETQPAGGRVLLTLTDSPAGTVLRVDGDRAWGERKARKLERNELASSTANQRDAGATSAATSTLRRVKRAIASRVLETAGASLVFGDGGSGNAGFVLRFPRLVAPRAASRSAPRAASKDDGASSGTPEKDVRQGQAKR